MISTNSDLKVLGFLESAVSVTKRSVLLVSDMHVQCVHSQMSEDHKKNTEKVVFWLQKDSVMRCLNESLHR